MVFGEVGQLGEETRAMLRPVMIFTSGGLENGGGIGRMVGYMVKAWQARGDAPKLVIVDTRGPARHPAAPVFFLAAVGRLLLAAVTSRPLAHVHIAGRGSTVRKVVIVAVAKLLGLRVVLHLHDYNYRSFLQTVPSALVWTVRAAFQAADSVVVLGSADKATVIEALGVSPGRVVIVPNGVPPPRVEPPARPESGPVNVLFLGDPSRRKGVHDLLAAFARPELDVKAGAPPWSAIVAGGGGELEGFRADVVALGLEGRVSLPGWLAASEVADRLAQADVLVLPSYGEGMAMAVLEAMSYGLCVVSTPVGALAEVIEDGVNGLLVAPGDVEGLARTLRLCLDDAPLRRRLGAGARETFATGYDVRTYPDRILAAFDLALR